MDCWSLAGGGEKRKAASWSLVQVQMALRALDPSQIAYIQSCVAEGMLVGDLSTIDGIPDGLTIVETLLSCENEKANKILASVLAPATAASSQALDEEGAERPNKRRKTEGGRQSTTPTTSNTTNNGPTS